METHTQAVAETLEQLRQHGLSILGRQEWTMDQRRYLNDYFQQEILPVLTPLAVQGLVPCPLLPGLQLNVALTLGAKEEASETGRLLVIPVPGRGA